MTYVIETFGGLNLMDDVFEVGATGAVDLVNVWFPHGRLASRPTATSFATGTRAVRRIHPVAAQLLASESDGSNVTLEAFDAGGSSLATTSYASASVDPHTFVSIGSPAATATYAIRTGDTTRKWNGAAWSNVAAVPAGWTAAGTNDFRLAIATTDHRVIFSDPGNPESFPANNFEELDPGDGQKICALVRWRDYLFAFKNTKFYMFYGTSVDVDGEPIFNYRSYAVGLGMGAIGSRVSGACAGPDGVYFVSNSGVWRTDGSNTQLVSRAISPLFPADNTPTTTTVPAIVTTAPIDLSWAYGSLYLSAGNNTGGPKTTYVFRDGQWTYWDLQASSGAEYANVVEFISAPYFVSAGSTAIKSLPVQTFGSVTWSYKTGRYSLAGDTARVAVTSESSLIGAGAVTMRLDSDLYSNISGAATLGTAPATAEGWPGVDMEGTWQEMTLSGTTAATVHRVSHDRIFVRPSGTR